MTVGHKWPARECTIRAHPVHTETRRGACATSDACQNSKRHREHAPINVLLRTHGLSHGTLAIYANVGAERELDEDAAHGLVVVELPDDVDDVGDLRLLGDLDVLELDADLLRGLRLHAHIHG